MKKLQVLLATSLMMIFILNVIAGERHGRSPAEKPHPAGIDLNRQPDTVFPLPFNEDFESGLGSWAVSGMWNIPASPANIHVLNPDIHPTLVILPEPPGSAFIPMPVSGNGMAWFGEASTGTFLGSNFNTVPQTPLNGGTSDTTQYGWLISPPIDMTAVSNATLSFAAAWEIEGVDVDAYDLMNIEISTDGGINWTSLGLLNPLNDVDGEEWKPYSSGGLAQPIIWENHLFDLTNFVGNTVHLGFYFDSGDDLYNGFRGWFVDDVSVTGTTIPAPDITSIVPSTSAAGEIVDIFGQNFANGATVEVGGNFATSSIFSTTQAEIITPFLSPGQYDLKLTNPDGQFDTVVNGLTITGDAPPDAISIDPDSAMVGTSAFVTISGFNFQPGATADIGGTPLSNLTVVNEFSITGDSPASLPAGTYNVRVINPDAQFDQLPGAFTVYSSTGINDNGFAPNGFGLQQNYPNPFNPSTTIEFQMPNASMVTVSVFNLAGQEVATILNDYIAAGQHRVEFNAENLPSGIYFYRLNAGDYSAMKKMILMK